MQHLNDVISTLEVAGIHINAVECYQRFSELDYIFGVRKKLARREEDADYLIDAAVNYQEKLRSLQGLWDTMGRGL